MIHTRSLYFRYGSQTVLHDINLQLNAGSITGLIGANGAGKSTLMRCLAGLETPYSGDVLLDNEPILDNPRRSFSRLGYLPDLFGLPEQLTVLQCLSYAAASRMPPRSDLSDAVHNTAALLDLDDKLDKKVGGLSRGQKQRVGIGQVIIHRPQFLLLDEPASGLDPEARHSLSLLLRRLQGEGMTILVSSHILSELDEYCTHMLVIKDGRIQIHRALDESGGTQHSVRLEFAADAAPLLETVRGLEMVREAHAEGNAVTAVIASDVAVQAALIAAVVGHGLPLSAVYPVKTSLLQSYQDSLNIRQGDAS